MRYLKLFENRTFVFNGQLLEIGDEVFHEKFGRGEIIDMRFDKEIATIKFDSTDILKDLRIDISAIKIDSELYDLRNSELYKNMKKYNL